MLCLFQTGCEVETPAGDSSALTDIYISVEKIIDGAISVEKIKQASALETEVGTFF